MSRSDATALLTLAESIADGALVDWDAAEARASAGEQAVVRQLRILSNLAGLHRSLPSDPHDLPPASAARRTATAPAIGSWAHLELIERLGGGTFGEVYRAWDRHLEREVALKLLRGVESTDDLHASRIATEGRLLARVRHTNVITVHGVAAHDQRVGLWMDLVRGATLEQHLVTHGPLSAREASLVGIDLCRALAAIHAAGLIHRDVKAQNVMREDGGRIVLMDLGTSREADSHGRREAQDFAGTPLYLAPEIFTSAPASERTDLYSLGVLLYHLVTGSFPVRATTIEALREGHTKGTAVRLRDARADLPTVFVRVVDRATASDPSRRYESAGALEADLVEALGDTPTEAAPVVASRQPRAPRLNRRWVGALVVALALAAVTAAIGVPRLREALRPSIVPGTIRSIAVLPLANLSGDASQDYFADGMTDELIGALGQLAGVNVISRTSAMQFKGSKQPLPEIARALHVDAVLEGSVIVVHGGGADNAGTAKRVRVNARLIYAGTDTQVWDRTFEALVSDVFAVRDDLVHAITDAMNVHLTAKVAPSPAQDFDAFDLYLRGRYYWNTRTEEGLKRSIQYFQEALGRRADYALAHAGLSDAYSLLGYYGFAPRGEAHDRAAAAATRALELDETLAEAHASLAFIHEDRFEWEPAEAEYRRALALKPGYATAHHWYGYQLAQRGRIPEALTEMRKAVELDPLSVGVNGALGSVLVYARQYDEAIEQLEKAIRMDPSFARSHMELAKAYLLKGLRDRALAEADKVAALRVRDVQVRGDIGYIHAVSGRRSDAERIAREIVERYRQGDDGAAMAAAIVYTGLGANDQALQWLERARQAFDAELPGIKMDPRLDRFRADNRFGKILAEIGLAQ